MRTLAAAVLALVLTVPLQAQNVAGFERELRQMDEQGDAVHRVEYIGSKVLYVYVTDGWYYLRCFQKQRFAKAMRRLWRQHGGDQVVLKDKTGTEVADWKMLSSDFDIRGCDD